MGVQLNGRSLAGTLGSTGFQPQHHERGCKERKREAGYLIKRGHILTNNVTIIRQEKKRNDTPTISYYFFLEVASIPNSIYISIVLPQRNKTGFSC